MTMRVRAIIIALTIVFTAQASAAMDMWGSTGKVSTNAGAVGTVDQSTAAFSLVGSTGRPGITSLAFGNFGVLYGVDCSDTTPGDPCWLLTIDPSTGLESSEIGQFTIAGVGANPWVMDLAVDPTTNLLWGMDFQRGLVKINKNTAEVTLVGALPVGIQEGAGIAITPDGKLYAAQSDGNTVFWELSKTDASVVNTIAFSPAGIQSAAGLGARPSDGLLFANERRGAGGKLYTIDPTTGAVTVIGTPSEALSDVAFFVRAVPMLPGGAFGSLLLASLLVAVGFYAVGRRSQAA